MPTAKGMPCQIRSAHGPCHLHRHLTRASSNAAAVPPIGAPEGQAKGPTNIDRASATTPGAAHTLPTPTPAQAATVRAPTHAAPVPWAGAGHGHADVDGHAAADEGKERD
jgi:hypothetical protein